MERWFSPEMSPSFLLLGLGFLSLSAVFTLVIGKVRGAVKPYIKSSLLYMVACCALFALAGLCITIPFSSYLKHFVFFQIVFIVIGTAHLFLQYRFLKWAGEGSFWAQLIFLVILMVAGAMCFVMTYRITNREGIELIMATAVTAFIVPFFVFQTYSAAIGIPAKIFRQWHYPVNAHIQDPDESKLKNLLVISFEFQKKETDRYFTNFRAKAPADMEFGQLFYYFINDYNERHPNAAIHFAQEGAPNGWIFFKKPRWYTIVTQYVDTDRTIFLNNIKENDVIICSRIS